MKTITLFIISLLIFSVPVFGQTMPVKIYLGNKNWNPDLEDCGKVYPVTRNIPKTKAVATAALEELFKGPTPDEEAKGYNAFPAADSKGILKSVKIKKGAAYVNFKKIITTQFHMAATLCGHQFVSTQIEMTLKQFPGVKEVYYAIEGRPCEYYYFLEFSECPLEPKYRSGKNF